MKRGIGLKTTKLNSQCSPYCYSATLFVKLGNCDQLQLGDKYSRSPIIARGFELSLFPGLISIKGIFPDNLVHLTGNF